MLKYVGCVLLLLAYVHAQDCEHADFCVKDKTECNLPDCLCSGEEPDIDAKSRPQIVYLTYDDAFTQIAEENYYRTLFDGTYMNPDGNPIRATHFLCAAYTDYTLVHDYWKKGHEMASHSITHKTPEAEWAKLNKTGWIAEAEGMRQMISQFAAIPKDDIQGFRSPFLRMGGDEMYGALSEVGFKYDCSWASRDFGYMHMDQGLFPYTMDYFSVEDCEVPPCPTCSHPGFWVQPMLDLEDNWFGSNPLHPEQGNPCSMLDGCVFIDPASNETTVKEMLLRNFNRIYNGNRAPFGLYMHAAWFFGEQVWHYNGYKMFVEEITNYDDVWIVPVIEGINFYSKHWNTTNDELMAMKDDDDFVFGTKQYADRENSECKPRDPCRLEVHDIDEIPDGQERYMHICGVTPQGISQQCPSRYPWLNDPCGGNFPCE